MRGRTTAAAAYAVPSLDTRPSKPRTTGKKDKSQLSGKHRSRRVRRLAEVENERKDLNDAVGPTVRTGVGINGPNTALTKPLLLGVIQHISMMICCAFRNCLWLGICLISRLETVKWPRRPTMAHDSGAESGSVVPDSQRKAANQDVTAQQKQHGESLNRIAFTPSLRPRQGTNKARTRHRSALCVGSVDFVSGTSPTELDLRAFQDLIDSGPGSDRHLVSSGTLPPAIERSSVISLDVGKDTDWLPDLDVYAVASGSDGSIVVNFVAKLDTGADVCVMAERMANKFGIDQIDKSDQPGIEVLAEQGIKPVGRIDIDLHLASDTQWYGGSFYVIPDSVVRNRFDALFSRNAIGKMKLLLLGPKLAAQNSPIESS